LAICRSFIPRFSSNKWFSSSTLKIGEEDRRSFENPEGRFAKPLFDTLHNHIPIMSGRKQQSNNRWKSTKGRQALGICALGGYKAQKPVTAEVNKRGWESRSRNHRNPEGSRLRFKMKSLKQKT
jgi:hypothetical protein